MEKLVVNLEQAKRLRAAGWTKETVFVWDVHTDIFGTYWEVGENRNCSIGRMFAPDCLALIDATGCTEISHFVDNDGECWRAVCFDLESDGDSLMESLVRLFERQNESQNKKENER